MARILVITPRLPYPPTDGGRLRRYYILRSLSRNHTVDLVSICMDSIPESNQMEIKEIVDNLFLFKHSNVSKYMNSMISLAKWQPFQKNKIYFTDVQNWIDKNISKYDGVFCNTIQTAKYVIKHDNKKIIDLTDSVARVYNELGEISSFPLKYIYPIESKRLKTYEKEIVEEFNKTMYITQHDRDYVNNQDNSTVVIPNGVRDELLEYTTTGLDRYNSPLLVFLGSMDYPPNEDAVIYFSKQMLPSIRKEVTDVSFCIVGKSPSKRVRQLNNLNGVSVTGFVDEPAKYLSEADLLVAPMRYGSGLQNKLLEAFAVSCPVITTPKGFEGLRGKPGKHLVVAKENEFPQQVIKLLSDEKLRDEIAANGRKIVDSNYRWSLIESKLHECVSEVI